MRLIRRHLQLHARMPLKNVNFFLGLSLTEREGFLRSGLSACENLITTSVLKEPTPLHANPSRMRREWHAINRIPLRRTSALNHAKSSDRSSHWRPAPLLVSRADAAAIWAVSPRALMRLEKAGIARPITLAKSQNSRTFYTITRSLTASADGLSASITKRGASHGLREISVASGVVQS